MAILTENLRGAAPHRMTIDEYERFVEATGLTRTELLDGVVIDVSPEGPLHVDAVMMLLGLLADKFPDLKVANAGSIRLNTGTLVEPDVYVVNVARDRHANAADVYPTAADVLLVAEVSVHTLPYDTGGKLAAYARSGIPEYWVVNPRADGWVLRLTDPDDGHYRSTVRFPLLDGLTDLDGFRGWD